MASPTSPGAQADGEVIATPAAQDHAAATGVDLTQVQGTGTDGQITKADVEAAAKNAEADINAAKGPVDVAVGAVGGNVSDANAALSDAAAVAGDVAAAAPVVERTVHNVTDFAIGILNVVESLPYHYIAEHKTFLDDARAFLEGRDLPAETPPPPPDR